MALTDLQGNQWRLAWLLEVGGVPYRWYGGPPGCAPPSVNAFGATPYVDTEAVTSVSRQTSRLNELGGISDIGGVTVTLASRGAYATAGDPASVLMRTGARGVASGAKARLAGSIEHGASVSGGVVYVDRSLGSWPTFGGQLLFHIGQECFIGGATASGPDRFTGCSRAAIQSRVSTHIYDADRGRIPWVTAYPTAWRGRFARLRVAYVTGKALVDGDYYEVLRGIIDTDPAMAEDGLSVTVHLAPLTAVLKTGVGGDDQVTRLVHGWHQFEAGRACNVGHVQHFGSAAAYWDRITGAVGGAFTIPVVNSALHDRWSDETLDASHPRRLLVETTGNSGPILVDAYPLATQLETATSPAGTVSSAHEIKNLPAAEVKVVDLSTATQPVAWPHGVPELVNVATGWTPGQVDGVDGAWADVRVELAGDTGLRVSCRLNGDGPTPKPLALIFRSDWRSVDGDIETAAGVYPGNEPTRPRESMLWYGLDFAAPDEQLRPDYRGSAGIGEAPLERWGSQSWTHTAEVSAYTGGDRGPDVFECRGVADAFYQTGEAAFWAEDNILSLGLAGSQYVAIKWHEGDQELEQVVPVSAVNAVADPDTNPVGYGYTIGEAWRLRARSFGDWPGQPRAEIRPAAVFDSASSKTVLLELLLSGRGMAVNDATWDQLPFGANLVTADVDEASFGLRASSGIADNWTFVLKGGGKVDEIITPILRATGSSLAMRLDPTSKRQRLTLVPVGHEHALDSVATLVSGDVSVDGRPVTTRDSKVITRWQLSLNYDPSTDKPGAVLTYVDTDAMAEQGGDQAGTEKMELRGLVIGSAGDMVAVTGDLIAGLRRRFGSPRLKYEFSLAGGAFFKLAVGDVVKLTAPDAHAYDGSRGITALPMRVTSVSIDWAAGRADIEAVSYELRGSGYAPAMRVASVVDADTVTVSANAYTATTHPVTGAVQTDVSYFAVSDAVYCVPRGDWAGKTAVTISTIVGNDVTFSGAHGLAAGDTIRPQPYDQGTAAMKAYAFVADSSDTLGAAADAGYEYA